MPDTMMPAADADTQPPRDVPLSFHHRAVALKLNAMFDAGDFDRLNLARRQALRTAILCIEQLGDLADDAVRDERAGERIRSWQRGAEMGKAAAELSYRQEGYNAGTRDGATIEHNRILGLPWWRRMLGRVG